MRLMICLILGSFMAVAFNNCSGFKSNQASRAEVLSARLLSGASDDDVRPPTNPDPRNPTNPDPPVKRPPPPSDPIPVSTACSSDDTSRLGGNVLASSTLIGTVLNSSGQVVCTISDASLRSTLINNRKVDATLITQKCPTLPEGKYTLELKSGPSANLFIDAKNANLANVNYPGLSFIKPTILGPNPTWLKEAALNAIFIFYYGASAPFHLNVSQNNGDGISIKANPDAWGAVLFDSNPGYQTYSDAKCDLAGSPLIVQIHPGKKVPEPIKLSAPLDGIEFDIFGANSWPRPYTKKLISWITADKAAGNYFIVLPDANGQVRGIDQMFGDNTRGPDGKFAPTGYEALGKWDLDHDGEITAKDDVYSDLRLWSDLNANGIAEASELHTLKELDVVSIDLDYDRDYVEHDGYGNEIRYKSITKTGDGLEHVTYDIWFRALPTYAKR